MVEEGTGKEPVVADAGGYSGAGGAMVVLAVLAEAVAIPVAMVEIGATAALVRAVAARPSRPPLGMGAVPVAVARAAEEW